MTKEGRLRLPAVVRQWCGLAAGDRVFLAAEPEPSRCGQPPLTERSGGVSRHAAAPITPCSRVGDRRPGGTADAPPAAHLVGW
ncbi:hypothetical protein [Micromonospora sp. NPDC002575]|uniref:hypothetical protein n=1 Tax=Micromonospora sp. NPDC002575 TaxID=3364222 RepID=UPI0036843A98